MSRPSRGARRWRRVGPTAPCFRVAGLLVVGLLVVGLSLVGAPARGQTADELVASGAVRVRSRVVPEGSILVGQKVTLYVDVLTSSFFPQPVRFPDVLEVADAVVLPSTSGGSFVDRIDGQSFAGISRRYDIFPMAPGTFRTPEVAVSAVVALDGAARSPAIDLVAPSVAVEVALPPGIAGRGLVVASPSLGVEERWEPPGDEVRVGDAVSRSVETTVSDSVSMLLPAPDLGAPDGVAAYPREPVFEDRSERGRQSGARRDEVTYVFEREGTFEWPAVEIAWWETSTGELRTEVLPARQIRVMPDPNVATDPFAEVDEDDEVAPGPGADEVAGRSRILALGLLLLVLVVGVWRVLVGWRAREADPEAVFDRRARQTFARFERAARSNDPEASYRELMSWLAIVGPGAGVASLAELTARRPGLQREVETLERRLYGSPANPAGSWGGRPFLEEVDAVRIGLRSPRRSARAGGGLPPTLNPHGPAGRALER